MHIYTRDTCVYIWIYVCIMYTYDIYDHICMHACMGVCVYVCMCTV